ncbi:hypothetical protein CC78DRAFT_171041 [Lojkania enalia]|uniref:Uncharacterized protein n=1 Tax=Lojkania enalia TaxID=147567 RepID=A0A9P4JWE1_9PLEO|nr:hypothetical protein CC78DRAFT_171041 [Didymosphaeria enalia]
MFRPSDVNTQPFTFCLPSARQSTQVLAPILSPPRFVLLPSALHLTSSIPRFRFSVSQAHIISILCRRANPTCHADPGAQGAARVRREYFIGIIYHGET